MSDSVPPTPAFKRPKSNRGFASMTKEKQRAIASKGGKGAHARGTAHKWTSSEASEAGKLGGATVSADRTHMSEIGRLGGKARGQKGKSKTNAESEEVGDDEQ